MSAFRLVALRCLILCSLPLTAYAGGFRVYPYLQNPDKHAITVRWLSEKEEPGTLIVASTEKSEEFRSEPVKTPALAYNPFGQEPADRHASLPFLHSVRVKGLQTATRYEYVVRQSGEAYAGSFKTAPEATQPIQFVVFADSETEPESSTTNPVDWPAHASSNRPKGITRYLVNQTIGFQQNLNMIAARQPDFLCIAGDLVESGGEQRDWDELWRHLAGDFGKVASRIPVLPALGNHENFGGPGDFGGYSAKAADFSVDKHQLIVFQTGIAETNRNNTVVAAASVPCNNSA